MSKKYVNVRILREDKTLTGKTYTFVSEVDCDNGDFVLVDTRFGFQVARVTHVAESPLVYRAFKDVICKVDLQNYIKKQEQEKILREIKSLVQKYESLTNG